MSHLITIPFLVSSITGCGSDSSESTSNNTNTSGTTNTTTAKKGSALFFGFTGGATSMPIDVAVKDKQVLDTGTNAATMGSINLDNGAAKGDNTDLWGFMIPYADLIGSAGKNVLMAFKTNDVYDSALTAAKLNVALVDMDNTNKRAVINTSVLDTAGATKLTALVASPAATEFPDATAADGLLGAATKTDWATKSAVSYAAGTKITSATVTAFQTLTFAPLINGTAIKAAPKITFAILQATDFGAGIYTATGADAAAAKYDVVINGFSAKSSVSTVTNQIVVPNISGFTVAASSSANAGLCAVAPVANAVGGLTTAAFALNASSSVTFKGKIWLNSAAIDKTLLAVFKAGSNGARYSNDTIKMNIGGTDATMTAILPIAGDGTKFAAALSGQHTGSQDIVYSAGTALTAGQWNAVTITLTSAAANSFACDTNNYSGALTLHLVNTAPAAGALLTTVTSGGSALMSANNSNPSAITVGKSIPSTNIRFVAQ